MAIVKPLHIINAYIAKDATDNVRYKCLLNIAPIIEKEIIKKCKAGKLSCQIDYECLLRNDDDIINDKISPNLIAEYLKSHDYKVDIIHKPELSFYISWDI